MENKKIRNELRTANGQNNAKDKNRMFDWMRSICIFDIIECIIMLIKYLILFISSRYHMKEYKRKQKGKNETQNDKINSNELFNF